MSVIKGCGLNLASVTPGDLDEADRLMSRWAGIGCTHVEISARRLDIIVGGRLNMPAVRRVAAMIERYGMAPVLHAPHGINLTDRPRCDMHVVVPEAAIEFCRVTGCASMVLHSGFAQLQKWVVQKGILLAEEKDLLLRLGNLAETAGCNLAVETTIASPAQPGFSAMAPIRLLWWRKLAATDNPCFGACLFVGKHAGL
ncbi:MAG: sugar phosphate isomerase/epimerase [Rhodobacteraceae bacterium]|nr:sugar phosphate isomerase/epimerase [Paracoccaceae bacterium]